MEILSSGTFEVQAALLSKLTTIFRDPTAEAQLSEQCRKDLSDIHKMLAMCRNEPVYGIDVQQFTMAAKACSTGPVFHLRVSKLGVKIFAQLATAASSERSLAVFQRRWLQTKSMIEELLKQTFDNVEAIKESLPAMTKVQAEILFLKGASKATLEPAELLKAYSDKLENMWGQVLKPFQEAAEAEAKACLERKLSDPVPTFKALSLHASLAALVCKDVLRGTVPEPALQEKQLVAESMPRVEALLAVFIKMKREVGQQVLEEFAAQMAALSAAVRKIKGAGFDYTRETMFVELFGGSDKATFESVAECVRKASELSSSTMQALIEERLKQYEETMLCSSAEFIKVAEANALTPKDVMIPFEFDTDSLREALEKNKALVDMAASRFPQLSGAPAAFKKAQDAVEACKGPEFLAELAFMKAVDDAQILFLTACSRWVANVKICAATDAFKAAHPKNGGLEEIVDAPTADVVEALKKKIEEMHEIASKIDGDSRLGLREGHDQFVDEAQTIIELFLRSLSRRWSAALKPMPMQPTQQLVTVMMPPGALPQLQQFMMMQEALAQPAPAAAGMGMGPVILSAACQGPTCRPGPGKSMPSASSTRMRRSRSWSRTRATSSWPRPASGWSGMPPMSAISTKSSAWRRRPGRSQLQVWPSRMRSRSWRWR